MSSLLTTAGRPCPLAIKAETRRSFRAYAEQQASRGNPIQPVHLRELMRREIGFFQVAADDEAARFGRTPREIAILDLKARLQTEPGAHGSAFDRDLCRRRLQAELAAAEAMPEPVQPFLMAAE